MASGQRPEFVCPCHTACVHFASAICHLSKVKGGLFRSAFKEGTFIIRWRCASQGFSEKPWLWAKEGSKAKGLGWLVSTGRPDMAASLDHTIWVWPTVTTIDFRSQRGSETMSRSSLQHHDLAHFFRGATLDDIHGLKFRHWTATAAPTRLVGVCFKQVLQPRTDGAGQCATLAKSKAHAKKLGVHSWWKLRQQVQQWWR